MSMVPFHTIDSELAFREMRTAFLPQPLFELPAGSYGFMECYCVEPGCDCRRVLIQVISPPENPKILAHIGYGWEPLSFYNRLMQGDQELGREMKGPYLDPLLPQAPEAKALLRLFEQILEDNAYVE